MICGMWKGVKAVSYHGRARSHCSSTTETNASGATERGIVKSNVVVVFIVVGLMRHNLCESLSGGFGGGVLRSPNIRHGRTSGPCTRMAVQRRHHHRRVWRRRRPRWALLPIVGSPPIHLQNHKKIEKINIKGKKSDLIHRSSWIIYIWWYLPCFVIGIVLYSPDWCICFWRGTERMQKIWLPNLWISLAETNNLHFLLEQLLPEKKWNK